MVQGLFKEYIYMQVLVGNSVSEVLGISFSVPHGLCACLCYITYIPENLGSKCKDSSSVFQDMQMTNNLGYI